MATPWQTLGLDRSTATERDVKAAYARLLKLHRPDQDPEGFQRLRAAYLSALAQLQAGHHEADKELPCDLGAGPVSGHGNSGAPASDVALVPMEDLVDAVEKAFDAGSAEDVWQSLRAFIGDQRCSKEERRALHANVAKVAARHSGLLHQAVTRERLLRSLESQNAALFHFMCDHWRDAGNTTAPPVVGKHILSHRAASLSREGAWALARLGELLGFRHEDVARKLADMAYQHLPAEARDTAVEMVEREVALGKIFFGFPPEQLKFWLPRLREPDRAWDWTGPQVQAAFDYIIRARSITWAGLPPLCNLLPPPVGESLYTAVLEVAKKAQDEYYYGGGILPASVAKGANYIHYYFFVFMTIGCMTLLALFGLFPRLREWFSEVIAR